MKEKEYNLRFENVSKKFCRNLKHSLFYGLQDIFKEMLGINKPSDILKKNEFWALKDVTFNIEKGDSLGLIGANGAGKTTILKLISGLIKPNNGEIKIDGSLSAIIALGASFNPLLTGRENIKVASSTYGYSKSILNKKYDEIVEFSELGDFIDAPVQSYSSGMLARLGFSIAITQDCEILLIDEVLAVGDLSFVIKCHKKIYDFQKKGGTLILVSHGLHNIRFHCNNAIWLDHGEIKISGKSNEICDQYESYYYKKSHIEGEFICKDTSLTVKDVVFNKILKSNEEFIFNFNITSKRPVSSLIICFAVFDYRGEHLFSNYSNFEEFNPELDIGCKTFSIKYNTLPIASGTYTISLIISENVHHNHLLFFKNYWKFEIKNNYTNFGILDIKPVWRIL